MNRPPKMPYLGVGPQKIGGFYPPKWMVIYNGNPYFLMDDLGGKPTIFGNTHLKTASREVFLRRHRDCYFFQ